MNAPSRPNLYVLLLILAPTLLLAGASALLWTGRTPATRVVLRDVPPVRDSIAHALPLPEAHVQVERWARRHYSGAQESVVARRRAEGPVVATGAHAIQRPHDPDVRRVAMAYTLTLRTRGKTVQVTYTLKGWNDYRGPVTAADTARMQAHYRTWVRPRLEAAVQREREPL